MALPLPRTARTNRVRDAPSGARERGWGCGEVERAGKAGMSLPAVPQPHTSLSLSIRGSGARRGPQSSSGRGRGAGPRGQGRAVSSPGVPQPWAQPEPSAGVPPARDTGRVWGGCGGAGKGPYTLFSAQCLMYVIVGPVPFHWARSPQVGSWGAPQPYHCPIKPGLPEGPHGIQLLDVLAGGFPALQGQPISLGKGLAVLWEREAQAPPAWDPSAVGRSTGRCEIRICWEIWGNVGPPYRNHCHPTSKRARVASGSVGSSAVVCG